MKIVPFIGDGPVIFRVENEGKPNAYVWVGRGKPGTSDGIRVTSFYGVASKFNHDPEPEIVCSKVSEEVIDKAFDRLEKCPKEDLNEMFDEFNKQIEKKQKDENGWKEYCDWEEYALDQVKRAEDGDGEVIF